MDGPEDMELTSPPSKTAGEQDHSDPWAFAGDEAEAPEDPMPESVGQGPLVVGE